MSTGLFLGPGCTDAGGVCTALCRMAVWLSCPWQEDKRMDRAMIGKNVKTLKEPKRIFISSF